MDDNLNLKKEINVNPLYLLYALIYGKLLINMVAGEDGEDFLNL